MTRTPPTPSVGCSTPKGGGSTAGDPLFAVAAQLARATFDPEPRTPRVFAGDQGNRDLAMMSRVAFIEIPALTRRFDAEWASRLERLHRIDGHTRRLRVINGGRA